MTMVVHMNMVEETEAIVARIRGMRLAPDVETTRITEVIASLPGMQTTDDVHRFREWWCRSDGEAPRNESSTCSRASSHSSSPRRRRSRR